MMAANHAFGNGNANVHAGVSQRLRQGMRALFEAQTVAIVGASNDAGKIAGRPLAYMRERNFTGRLIPVNPNRTTVQGIAAFPSLGAADITPDLAIIGTPAPMVIDAVKEGMAAGVKAFVIFSSGFSETGEAGAALQNQLSAMAQASDSVILGPNCLGAVNARTGMIASFTTALERANLLQGSFAMVSQSGAIGAYLMDLSFEQGCGFSKWITTGNECDLDVAAAIDYLADDPETRVIGVYLEDIRNVSAFRLALRKAAENGKPVIVIKSGRSRAGAAAAASHTGAMTGDDTVFQACITQSGALRVYSLTEMMDVVRLVQFDSVPASPRMAVMSVSGGAGVMIADEAEEAGLELPAFSPQATTQLRKVLPPFVTTIGNPLDLTGNVLKGTDSIRTSLETVAADHGIDGIILFVGLMHSIATAFTDAIRQLRAETDIPVIVIWAGATHETTVLLNQSGIPLYPDIPVAVRAVSAGLSLRRLQTASLSARLPLPEDTLPPHTGTVETLMEWQGKAWLTRLDLFQIPRGKLLTQAGALAETTAELRYPLVAKMQASTLVHKSDIGGVLTGISNPDELADAVQELQRRAASHDQVLDGILVEEMVSYDHELVLGLRRDPRFGPILTLGRGGIEVELNPDFSLQLLPVSEQAIHDMLSGLKVARLLEGYRGQPKADLHAISRRIHALCEAFASDSQLAEIEINPLGIKGDQVWGLDAIMRLNHGH